MNTDMDILNDILRGMAIPQRREWLVKMLMAKHGITFEAIAKRHRLNKWYINGSLIGKFPMGSRVVKAIESQFGIDLGPFMTKEEKKRMGRI